MNLFLDNCILAGDLTGKCVVCVLPHSTVCRRSHLICFHSLMVFRSLVSHVLFCHWGFSLFFLSLTLLQLSVLAKEKGSDDPATPISLETDEAASLLLLLPLLSSPSLMTSLCRPWRTERSGTFCTQAGAGTGRCVSEHPDVRQV